MLRALQRASMLLHTRIPRTYSSSCRTRVLSSLTHRGRAPIPRLHRALHSSLPVNTASPSTAPTSVAELLSIVDDGSSAQELQRTLSILTSHGLTNVVQLRRLGEHGWKSLSLNGGIESSLRVYLFSTAETEKYGSNMSIKGDIIHVDLLTTPAYTEQDLGSPLPPSHHACSVALPLWSHVVGYEEGDANIISKLTCGKLHSTISCLYCAMCKCVE